MRLFFWPYGSTLLSLRTKQADIGIKRLNNNKKAMKKEKRVLPIYYTLSEISAAYSFSLPTLRKYIESGELDAVEILGQYRVSEEALAALVRKPLREPHSGLLKTAADNETEA